MKWAKWDLIPLVTILHYMNRTCECFYKISILEITKTILMIVFYIILILKREEMKVIKDFQLNAQLSVVANPVSRALLHFFLTYFRTFLLKLISMNPYCLGNYRLFVKSLPEAHHSIEENIFKLCWSCLLLLYFHFYDIYIERFVRLEDWVVIEDEWEAGTIVDFIDFRFGKCKLIIALDMRWFGT